ncbi:MAG: hypothetical protein ACLGI5_01295 [Thermoleophilia bacterium]
MDSLLAGLRVAQPRAGLLLANDRRLTAREAHAHGALPQFNDVLAYDGVLASPRSAGDAYDISRVDDHRFGGDVV